MKIVYSYYVLDLVHKGHLIQMMNAKRTAGKEGRSIVGILTDEAVMEKKSKPILSFDERVDLANAIRFVDLVVPQETYSPLPNLYRLKPDVVMESDSHEPDHIKRVEDYMTKINGRVIVTPYYPLTSSTYIKQKIKGGK